MIELPVRHNHQLDPVWNTAVKLLSPSDNLPIPDTITNLYLDFETTSTNPSVKSLNPHRTENCKILGVAVLFDNEQYPYYVPVRHCILNDDDSYSPRQDYPNFSPERVHEWLRILMQNSRVWINQNVKYDYHVLLNETGTVPRCKLIDTLTLAKLSEFDEQMSYSLDSIMKLFGIDITPYEKVIKQFLGTKLKDYGLIPTDLMATYAAVDVLSCRYIHRNIKIHSECSRVLEMEHSLLPLLIQLEQVGLHVDFNQLIKDWHEINLSQLERIRKIKALAGLDVFDPSKKKSLKELFCDKLGWELNWTDKSYEKFLNTGDESDLAESYSKESILKHRKENPELVDTWRDYQRDEKLRDSFIIPYLEQHIDDNWLIHCSFNQIVRTGRMSCRTPNMQQLSKRAKTFVLPYTEDYVLVEFDLSQIEFRLLVHYINNIPGIKAFNENPKTDYHQWIGDECSVVRDIAKRVNFGTGYGAGKARVCEILSNEQSFLNSLNGELAEVRASNIVDKYYATLPELKPTRQRAANVLVSRGYVRTIMNRQRRLPKFLAHRAFPSICQGSAADILKEKTLGIRQFLSVDCILHLLVHDAWIFSIRKERVAELVPLIKQEIERPIEGIDLSVPLMSKYKICPERWSIGEEYD